MALLYKSYIIIIIIIIIIIFDRTVYTAIGNSMMTFDAYLSESHRVQFAARIPLTMYVTPYYARSVSTSAACKQCDRPLVCQAEAVQAIETDRPAHDRELIKLQCGLE